MERYRSIPPLKVTTLLGSILGISGYCNITIVPYVRTLCAIATLLSIVETIMLLVVEGFTNQTYRNIEVDATTLAIRSCRRNGDSAKTLEGYNTRIHRCHTLV